MLNFEKIETLMKKFRRIAIKSRSDKEVTVNDLDEELTSLLKDLYRSERFPQYSEFIDTHFSRIRASIHDLCSNESNTTQEDWDRDKSKKLPFKHDLSRSLTEIIDEIQEEIKPRRPVNIFRQDRGEEGKAANKKGA